MGWDLPLGFESSQYIYIGTKLQKHNLGTECGCKNG
jgi:hypothetical protein